MPVFVILKYTRAEREADWALHLDTVKDMVPLFFSAGHVHYARYALYYLRTVEGLPDGIRAQFINGQQTMHHNACLFNGIWSDMANETTFVRYCDGQSWIIGITLKPETLKTCAYSLHTCHGTIDDLSEMRNNERPSAQTSHKKETAAKKSKETI